MAGKKQESKKGRPRKTGKSGAKIERYFSSGRLLEKKIRRMIRHNGVAAARKYAEASNAIAAYRRIENSGLIDRFILANSQRRQARKARRAM